MADITLTNNKLFNTDAYTGGIICRTPKTLNSTSKEDDEYVNWCRRVSTRDELVKYFGDPYIDPKNYADLILAYDLVARDIPVWISSIYDMKDNDDEFDISYNGYTEFMFVDEQSVDRRYDTVGYKLKSDIKFCQPIIEYTFDGINKLDIYIHRYILDKYTKKSYLNSFKLNDVDWYNSVHYEVKLTELENSLFDEDGEIIDENIIYTDTDFIKQLASDGFELKVVHGYCDNKTLIKAFVQNKKVHIEYDSYVLSYEKHMKDNNITDRTASKYNDGILDKKIEQDHYWYKINSDDYDYCLQLQLVPRDDNNNDDDEVYELNSTAVNYYEQAIINISKVFPKPHILCLGRLYSNTTLKSIESQVEYTAYSRLEDLNYNGYAHIQESLLSMFSNDCDTYLFINAIDKTANTVYNYLLNKEKIVTVNEKQYSLSEYVNISDNFNCDLYFGYVSDTIISALRYHRPIKIYYSTAILTFYNLLINSVQYVANSLDKLNIANTTIKDSINEELAEQLVDVRCNSVVLFDSGAPSVYGNKSLSRSPNLQYSHISRTFVYLRRLIREYLETQKFVLNTVFVIESIINYIKHEILDQFITRGNLHNYNINYTTDIPTKTVYITIDLLFYGFAKSITLDFTI